MLIWLSALAAVYLVSFSAGCSLLGRRSSRAVSVLAIAVSLAAAVAFIAVSFNLPRAPGA
ncbi:hypothetical protein [Frigoribacterium sp. SL97]|uniref:hypothetical protein n=1 Tax=Frigoribacterium sp. SL97 TaxID=2994664 RepID=UPI002270F681|nr:hypothetical protein [Frigoribacterium sp. SL97]WAC50312.1 hypothetical protein OVA02_10455 [Frigoribacterium sp. SL97]